MDTGTVWSFLSGMGYLMLGLFILMLIDTRTNRVERFTDNNDFTIFAILLAWPLLVPVMFLPRYGHRYKKSGL